VDLARPCGAAGNEQGQRKGAQEQDWFRPALSLHCVV
jgi:hypothetical protein